VGSTNSKPPGLIIVNGQSRIGSTGRFIFITLFSTSFRVLPPFFTSLHKLRIYVGEKLFSCTKSALFVDFSLSDFNVKCYILSTGGGCSYFSIGSKSFQYWQDFPLLSMVTLLLGFSAFCALGLEKGLSKFRQVGDFMLQ
jgi:hypothetical protein